MTCLLTGPTRQKRLTVEVDGRVTEWHEGRKSLGQWHVGANSTFDGTQVIDNFYNGIQVKLLSTFHKIYRDPSLHSPKCR
jgi:hypothetical protein